MEECGASLRHVNITGGTVMHQAYLDIVRYVAKKAPALIDMPTNLNTSLIMAASGEGIIPVVRHLTGLGCLLSRKAADGNTALERATPALRAPRHRPRLLFEIASAGGWPQYAAACRMAYVRIRHEVSKTYAVLDEGHDDRELYHFVFGKNEVVSGADQTFVSKLYHYVFGNNSSVLAGGEQVAKVSVADRRLLTLPEDLFRRVIGYL